MICILCNSIIHDYFLFWDFIKKYHKITESCRSITSRQYYHVIYQLYNILSFTGPLFFFYLLGMASFPRRLCGTSSFDLPPGDQHNSSRVLHQSGELSITTVTGPWKQPGGFSPAYTQCLVSSLSCSRLFVFFVFNISRNTMDSFD